MRSACVVILLTCFTGACRASPEVPAASQTAQVSNGFPRTLVDASGASITLAAPPARIVSQTLASDEILFALIDHARIVGVSTLASDPNYSNIVAEATALGAPRIKNAEDVIVLKPDLIFVASYSRAEVVDLLRASGAPVFRFASFDSIADLLDVIRTLGRAVGAETQADTPGRPTSSDACRRCGTAPVPAGPPPRVLSFSPAGQSAGKNTTFDDIVRYAGGINVAAEHGFSGFPRLSVEQLLAWDPDVVVTGARPAMRPT